MMPITRITYFNQILPILLIGLLGWTLFGGLTSVLLAKPILVVTHSLLEIASIILGFIIFYITWYGSNTNISRRVTVVSLVIISSTLFQLVHMLSYPGLATDSASSDHIWVSAWVASRLIWSFGMLYTLSIPPSSTTQYSFSNKSLLYCTLIAVAALLTNILFCSDPTSYLYIDRYNQPVVIGSQYCSLAANSLALFILCRSGYNHVGKLRHLALLFGIFTDLAFCLSIQTSFSLNIAGHLFNALANFYVLRSLYLQVIRQPYDEVLKLKKEMEELAKNNENLYQQSEYQRNMVEDILAKIGVIISSQLDSKETLDSIADMVADLMHARQSTIALFSSDHSVLKVAATYGLNAPPAEIPLNTSLAGQVCENRTALFIDDLILYPEIFRPQLVFANIRSMICAPLVNDGEIIGVFEAYSNEKAFFGKRDALLLTALGRHAGAAIFSSQLYEQTKTHLDEEKFLLQIAQVSAASIDPNTIIETCTAHVAKALDSDIAVGLLVSQTPDKMLICTSVLGLNFKPSCEIDHPDMANLIATPFPKITTIEQISLLKDLGNKYNNCPCMVIPLQVDHHLVGLIILGWHRFISTERLERTSFAALMANQIALGVEKAHLYNQVKAMALSDGLTGLANRRNFDLFLNTELCRASALKRPLSLIMLDLDKFKNYNDTYGHITGDKLLAQLGKILQQSLRSIDVPARYGGEEFSIILPECTNSEAMELAEMIRQKVECSDFPDNNGGFSAHITASLGVTTFDPALGMPMPTPDLFVGSADAALYQAKNQGRNRICNAAAM